MSYRLAPGQRGAYEGTQDRKEADLARFMP